MGFTVGQTFLSALGFSPMSASVGVGEALLPVNEKRTFHSSFLIISHLSFFIESKASVRRSNDEWEMKNEKWQILGLLFD